MKLYQNVLIKVENFDEASELDKLLSLILEKERKDNEWDVNRSSNVICNRLNTYDIHQNKDNFVKKRSAFKFFQITAYLFAKLF
jgi:hypothetical protein